MSIPLKNKIKQFKEFVQKHGLQWEEPYITEDSAEWIKPNKRLGACLDEGKFWVFLIKKPLTKLKPATSKPMEQLELYQEYII